MKKIIICMFFVFCFSSVNAANTLIDIENHWAKENIVRMLINGNISGYEDNTFRPNNEVTTLEFVKMAVETLDLELVKNGFNKWPDYYIATAKSYGLNYDYNKKLSRYESAEIIAKLIDVKDIKASSNKFKDLQSKYKSDVLKLVKLNIINGYEDNTFRGEKILTRAEAVTIVTRALEANNKIIREKKYEINERYTNYGVEAGEESEIDRIRYEVKNNKIFFYDKGRFSYIQGYSIDEKYISNKKIIKLLEALMSENSYTALYYVPSEYVINQVKILHGENDNLINRGLDYFSFTYYEDKLYDLKRISLKEEFTSECYLKITIKKLWKELYNLENKNFIDENIKIKLYKALEIEFGDDANEILEFMLDKYNKDMNNEFTEDILVEKVKIGKTIINFYKTDATSLEFYFEKLSS